MGRILVSITCAPSLSARSDTPPIRARVRVRVRVRVRDGTVTVTVTVHDYSYSDGYGLISARNRTHF